MGFMRGLTPPARREDFQTAQEFRRSVLDLPSCGRGRHLLCVFLLHFPLPRRPGGELEPAEERPNRIGLVLYCPYLRLGWHQLIADFSLSARSQTQQRGRGAQCQASGSLWAEDFPAPLADYRSSLSRLFPI